MKLPLVVFSLFLFALPTFSAAQILQHDCDITLNYTDNIAVALNQNDRVCLNPGVYELPQRLTLQEGKELLGNGQYDISLNESGGINHVVLTTTPPSAGVESDIAAGNVIDIANYDGFNDDHMLVLRNNTRVENLVIRPKVPPFFLVYVYDSEGNILTDENGENVTKLRNIYTDDANNPETYELDRLFVRFGIKAGTYAAETNPLLRADNAVIRKVIIKDVENPITVLNSDHVKVTEAILNDNGSPDDCQGDVAVFLENSDNLLLSHSKIVLSPSHRGKLISSCTIDPAHTNSGALDGDGSISCQQSTGFTSLHNSHIATGTGSYYFVDCDKALLLSATILDSQGWAIDGGKGSQEDLTVRDTIVRRSGRAAATVNQSTTGVEFTNVTFSDNNLENIAACKGVNKKKIDASTYNNIEITGNITDHNNDPNLDGDYSICDF